MPVAVNQTQQHVPGRIDAFRQQVRDLLLRLCDGFAVRKPVICCNLIRVIRNKVRKISRIFILMQGT
ncbi:hypothetical protein D3C86_2157670 [compost metagenome]